MPFDTCFIEHLHVLGEPEKAFSQGTGMDHFGTSMTQSMKDEVSLGYCFGASINWLKLCLVQEKFATAVSDKHSGLVTSMAKTHLEVKKAGATGRNAAGQELRTFSSDIQDDAWNKYQTQIRSINEKFLNWLRRLGCTVNTDGSYSYNRSLATKIQTAERAIEKAKAEAKREYDLDMKLARSQVELEKRKLQNDRGMGRTWNALKTVGAGLYTGDVVPVIADDARWDSTIGKFVCRAVSTPAFKVGRGMVFGFKTGKDPSAESTIELPPGHAIALRRTATSKYQMFDPNLGVYTYDSRANLIYALILLLADGYNKREIDHSEKADEWIVFCKTSDVIPEDPDWQVTDHEGAQAAWIEKDKVKALMRSKIDQLVETAFEKASYLLKIENGINQAEQQLKTYGKKVGNAWQTDHPQAKKAFEVYNKLIDPLKKAGPESRKACFAARVGVVKKGTTVSINDALVKRFVERGGKVEDTGLADLINSLDRIA